MLGLLVITPPPLPTPSWVAETPRCMIESGGGSPAARVRLGPNTSEFRRERPLQDHTGHASR